MTAYGSVQIGSGVVVVFCVGEDGDGLVKKERRVVYRVVAGDDRFVAEGAPALLREKKR